MNLACSAWATCSRRLPNGDRTTHRPANHHSCATCPAEVLSWVSNGDREIVAAPVLAGLRTGWTPCYVGPANLSNLAYMVQYPKLVTGWTKEPNRLVCRRTYFVKLRWHSFARSDYPELFFAHFVKAVQKCDLFF